MSSKKADSIFIEILFENKFNKSFTITQSEAKYRKLKHSYPFA